MRASNRTRVDVADRQIGIAAGSSVAPGLIKSRMLILPPENRRSVALAGDGVSECAPVATGPGPDVWRHMRLGHRLAGGRSRTKRQGDGAVKAPCACARRRARV